MNRWCHRNPSYKYQGPPPLDLAARLEDLGTRLPADAEEDAELAREMAKGVRHEAATVGPARILLATS
jgi:hypothetical protein